MKEIKKNKDLFYRYEYLRALKIAVANSVYSLIFSVVTLVLSGFMVYGGVGGAGWILALMIISSAISGTIFVKAEMRIQKEESQLFKRNEEK